MSRVVVLGAGISGHTAAAFLRKWLPPSDQVVVVSPNPLYNWIPSNIWVGVGLMSPDQVTFPLAPVYQRHGIDFKLARATTICPEGRRREPDPFVVVESTKPGEEGREERVPYDFLVNASGPKLNFAATEGLGPTGHTLSVCTAEHAAHTARYLDELVQQMRRGERKRFLVGTGHGACTCEGAAFDTSSTLSSNCVLAACATGRRSPGFQRVRIGRLRYRRHSHPAGRVRHAEQESSPSRFSERGIRWVKRAHVRKVEPGRAWYETLESEQREAAFDFAMLLPPFSGVGLRALDRDGGDITASVFMPNGFTRVDADYTSKPYQQWSARDWPSTYQSPIYPRLFATGIAFAPPHPISRPRQTPSGAPVAPAPPRTGMPSAMIGKAVARSVVDMLRGAPGPTHTASMAAMGAACVASAGANPFKGTAASMTVFPIVPDFERYPEYGRDLDYTFGEIGLAGHWIKIGLHHLFLHKARMRPGWSLVPE